MPVTVFPVGPFRRQIAGGSVLDPCQKSLGTKSLSTLWGTGTKIRWFDASQEAYLDNTRQATIHDFSVNSDNANQAVVSRQALFQIGSAPRGGPTFNFDAGIEGYLTSLGTAAGAYTIHAVVRYLLTNQTNNIAQLFAAFAVGGGFSITAPRKDTTGFWQAVNSFIIEANGGSGNGTGVLTSCGWQVVSVVFDQTNVIVYRNGTRLGSTTPAAINAPTSYSIGSGTPGTDLGSVMQLSELQMLSGVLTDAQVATDVAGAKTKWGLPI